jgi:hypothetical protein
MHSWQSLSGLALILGATGCFPTVPYEADKIGSLDTGGLGVVDDDGVTDPNAEDPDDTDDPNEECLRYADADGDGYGAGEGVSVACDAPGYSVTNDDCDDADPNIHPDASERCNGVDDDCDSTVDEDIEYDWYVDADGDGYGEGESLNDCDPPEDVSDRAGDCDDSNAAVNPDAAEVCNGIDDDCDALADDADDSVDLSTGTNWYADGDGDGFGGLDDVVVACASPGDPYTEDNTDCDDGNADIHPDAVEVCDGVDNDCDSAVDDADASLDVLSTTEWHEDADLDGYGATAVAANACEAPSGMVADASDCDDDEAAVNPAADEVCNGIDDDCDTFVDDADEDVDLATGTAFYSDADGDSYGDASTEVYACANPGSLVLDATDCDDGAASVNPAATEICNSIDDDCDTRVDDDDSSLDLSTATTWYTDSDGDGLGVSSPTTQTCVMPAGYADNDDDCDDGGFDDLDGDLLQDCEDPDADGDGLSSTYDADDLDDSVVRGSTGGSGADGALVVSSTSWSDAGDYTLLASDGDEDDTNVAVDSTSAFAVGDEVLIANMQGDDAGTHGFYFVTAIAGSTLELEPPLQDDFDADDTVVVQRVPHYTTATVSGTMSPEAWDGEGGGLLVFRATGAVTISGTVDASGMGYRGGSGVAGNSSNPTKGGTWSTGPIAADYYGESVDGGGGAAVAWPDLMVCGGGGAYGTDGGEGDYAYGPNGYSPGQSYGDSALSEWFFGSGGGGGSPDSESDGSSTSNISGDGGAGGGLIAIYSADSITVAGGIYADGESGEDARYIGSSWRYGEIGGGGGGAGGQILLVSDAITISGEVSAEGADGGEWNVSYSAGTGEGGEGGDGRTRMEYSTVSGSSSVSPSPSTGTYAD